MTVFDAVLQARDQAIPAGIAPTAVRLGNRQWQEVRRALADDAWLPCMEFREPSAFYLHGLRVHLALEEADLVEAIVYLQVPA